VGEVPCLSSVYDVGLVVASFNQDIQAQSLTFILRTENYPHSYRPTLALVLSPEKIAVVNVHFRLLGVFPKLHFSSLQLPSRRSEENGFHRDLLDWSLSLIVVVNLEHE
jgi:hypothetical protein